MDKTIIIKQNETVNSNKRTQKTYWVSEKEDQQIREYLYQNRKKEQNGQYSPTNLPRIIMKIELDEKRITLEHKYSLEKMWTMIDEICCEDYFTKVSKGYYRLNDGEVLLGAMLVVCAELEKVECLLPYFSVWLAGDEDGHIGDYLSAYHHSVEREKQFTD